MATSPESKPAKGKDTPSSRRLNVNLLCRAAADLLTRDRKLSGSVAAGGLTINDLMTEIRVACQGVPMLVDPCGVDWPCSPWPCNFIVPLEEGKPWTAIVRASNEKLYAVEFSLTAGELKVMGEPKEVTSKEDFTYVEEIIEAAMTENRSKAKPAAAHAPAPVSSPAAATGKRSKGNSFYRFSRVSAIDDDGAIQVAFSSEFPVRQTARAIHVRMGAAAKVGDEFWEVLSHKAGDGDLSQLNNTGAFLDEHVFENQLGSVRKATISDDAVGRAVLVPDLVTELSRTRAEQMRQLSRPHISFGYELTEFIGDDTLADGRAAKRFKWAAFEISSVAAPADPTVGTQRSSTAEEDPDVSNDSPVHCIHCAEMFPRSSVNKNFECADCEAEGRSVRGRQIDSQRSKNSTAMDNTISLTESQKQVTEARSAAVKGLFARNKEIADRVDAFIKDHGMKRGGKCGLELAKIATEFSQKDSALPTEQVMRELGERCVLKIGEYQPEPYLMRAQIGEAEASLYSFRRALQSCCRRNSPMPEGRELEVHQDMENYAKREAGGLGYEFGGGFHVPMDAPIASNRGRRGRGKDGNGFTRDLSVGVFGSGGALVPTNFQPMIELLRNRLALDWAGVTTVAGLTGNVAFPRQTAASAPVALGEIDQLLGSQPAFDQIIGNPKRIGNTVNYSKLLLQQSSPDAERVIIDDNFRAMALKTDALGLFGTGGNGEPVGVMEQPGILSVVFGGAANYAGIVNMETQIRQNNVYDEIKYLTTSKARGKLLLAPALLTGSTVVSGTTNAIWRASESGGEELCAARPGFDTQQMPNDQILAGAFEHLLMMMWLGFDVVLDMITRADRGEVKFTINTYVDFAVRHPQAFCVSADSAAQ